jgi:hypothetical protein
MEAEPAVGWGSFTLASLMGKSGMGARRGTANRCEGHRGFPAIPATDRQPRSENRSRPSPINLIGYRYGRERNTHACDLRHS